MESDDIESRIRHLEQAQRAWRRACVAMFVLLLAGLIAAGLRHAPTEPRIDERALDAILRAIHDNDAACGAHASRSSSFEDFRRTVHTRFDELVRLEASAGKAPS
jgi:hypothetical protein